MDSDAMNLKELQNRVSKLETQNRRFKQFGVLLLIVVGALLTMGQAPSRRIVEANEFILRDAKGKVRATLSMDESRSTPELDFMDEVGRSRIKLEGGLTGGIGGQVSVFDPQGRLGGIFSAVSMPGVEGGHISLLDSNRDPKTTLGPGNIWVNGGIRLEDDHGFAAWLGRTGLLSRGESRTRSAASLALIDNNKGQVIWQAP